MVSYRGSCHFTGPLLGAFTEGASGQKVGVQYGERRKSLFAYVLVLIEQLCAD